MADGRGGATSRAALLELRRERELIEQGHRFLDEKRMQLAREMLLRIETLENAQDEMNAAQESAANRFSESVTRYGFADLLLHPSMRADASLTQQETVFLGLRLPDSSLALEAGERTREPAVPRPTAEEAGAAFRDLAVRAADIAAMLAALLRIDAEYARTERSVRALENVVMPEIRKEEKRTAEAIEEIEQEEAVRVRLFAED